MVLSQKWLVVLQRREPGDRLWQRRGRSKQGNHLIGCSLSSCLIWGSSVGCLWLVVLRFWFLPPRIVGSDLGLLTWVPKALKLPQFDGFLVNYFNYNFYNYVFLSFLSIYSVSGYLLSFASNSFTYLKISFEHLLCIRHHVGAEDIRCGRDR